METIAERIERFKREFRALIEEGSHIHLAPLGHSIPSVHRKGLPIAFYVSNTVDIVMTGYDSGTAANHMSLAQASKLGLKVDTSLAQKSRFLLANGKPVNSIGRTAALLSFQGEVEKIWCYFNVFKTLAVPVLMGLNFLNATQTLSKFRNRLVDLPNRGLRSLRICAIGDASNEVVCIVDRQAVYAKADTGSEIALMSGRYARKRGILNPQGTEMIEFADGTIDYTSGIANVVISRPGYLQEKFWTRFHVFEHLTTDLLLDENLVENLGVFPSYVDKLVSSARSFSDDLCPIRHLGTVERGLSNVGNYLASSKVKAMEHVLSFIRPSTPNTPHTTEHEENQIMQQLNAFDQRENSIRAAKAQAIKELPAHMRQDAINTEQGRQREYIDKRIALLRRLEESRASRIPSTGSGNSSSSSNPALVV